jgi:hypothetical protein
MQIRCKKSFSLFSKNSLKMLRCEGNATKLTFLSFTFFCSVLELELYQAIPTR